MRNLKALRSALNTIQASGIDARTLSERTGMCYPTCRKILEDKKGQRGYHWSTIEFALKHIGCELRVVQVDSSVRLARTTGRYISRRVPAEGYRL